MAIILQRVNSLKEHLVLLYEKKSIYTSEFENKEFWSTEKIRVVLWGH